MVRLIRSILVGVLTFTSAALDTAHPVQAQPTPIPTPRTIYVYDMGIKFSVPDGWDVPNFTAGQVTISPIVANVTDPIAKPNIALRLVNPRLELGAPKDATLQDIALAAVSGEGVEPKVVNIALLAGLEAGYVETDAKVTVNGVSYELYGVMYALRLLDGRVMLFASTSPRSFYPDFNTVQLTIASTAERIDPNEYPNDAPITAKSGIKVEDKTLNYLLPQGWLVDQDVGGGFYRAPGDTVYSDSSGFVNGLSLTVVSVETAPITPTPASATINPAATAAAPVEPGAVQLAGLLQLPESIPIETVTLNGIKAYRYVQPYPDPQTGQLIQYYSVLSDNGRIMVAFRWARPQMLEWRTDPVIQTVMNSINWS